MKHRSCDLEGTEVFSGAVTVLPQASNDIFDAAATVQNLKPAVT
jgi:hypothetical protein